MAKESSSPDCCDDSTMVDQNISGKNNTPHMSNEKSEQIIPYMNTAEEEWESGNGGLPNGISHSGGTVYDGISHSGGTVHDGLSNDRSNPELQTSGVKPEDTSSENANSDVSDSASIPNEDKSVSPHDMLSPNDMLQPEPRINGVVSHDMLDWGKNASGNLQQVTPTAVIQHDASTALLAMQQNSDDHASVNGGSQGQNISPRINEQILNNVSSQNSLIGKENHADNSSIDPAEINQSEESVQDSGVCPEDDIYDRF